MTSLHPMTVLRSRRKCCDAEGDTLKKQVLEAARIAQNSKRCSFVTWPMSTFVMRLFSPVKLCVHLFFTDAFFKQMSGVPEACSLVAASVILVA